MRSEWMWDVAYSAMAHLSPEQHDSYCVLFKNGFSFLGIVSFNRLKTKSRT
jgi:hypothetical protein